MPVKNYQELTLNQINIAEADRELIQELMDKYLIEEGEILEKASEYISSPSELDTNMILLYLIKVINDILLDKLRVYLSPELIAKLSDDLQDRIYPNGLATHNYAYNTFEEYEQDITDELNKIYDDKAYIYLKRIEKQFESYHF